MAEEAKRPTREGKTVQRLEVGEVKEEKDFKVVEGKGTKLGDIPNVENRIGKVNAINEEIKQLHRLCFGTVGAKTVVKKHLRAFSGFVESQVEKKAAQINKLDGSLIKKMMIMCDVPTTGTKAQQSQRFAEFLDAPSASSKKTDLEKHGEKRKRAEKAKVKKAVSKGKEAAKGKSASKGKAGELKRPPTAFILYCNNKREKVKAENPDAAFGDLTKILAVKWKGISEERRANYLKQAADLKAEYDAKKAKLEGATKPKAAPKPKTSKAAKKEDEDGDEEDEIGDQEEGGGEEGGEEGDEDGGDEEGDEGGGGDEAADEEDEEKDEDGGDEEGDEGGGGDEAADEEDEEKEHETAAEDEEQPMKKKKSDE